MILRCGVRCTTAALITIFTLATGCVHRATVSQDFGLPGGLAPQKKAKTPPVSPAIRRPAAISPDDVLRATLDHQTEGAFNPLTDDRRIQSLQNRLKLDPQNPAARLELAGIYEHYRLCEDALEHYTESLRLVRSQPEPNGLLGEKAGLGLGRCARASGRARQAIPVLEAFLKEWPAAGTMAGLWNEVGLLYDALGYLPTGEKAFREAVQRNEATDSLHNNLGYNLLLQDKADAAESEFRRALQLNPKAATTRNNMGVILARRGDLQGALEQFQSAADAATAHNNLAVVLLEAGQYEKSREELVKALAIRHYFAPALANFKLVQERIREKSASSNASRLPPSTVRAPSALLQLGEVTPSASSDHSGAQQEGQNKGAEPKESEERP